MKYGLNTCLKEKKEFEPQRHRDTEKCNGCRKFFALFSSRCLCASVVNLLLIGIVMFFTGGFRISAIGWLTPHAIYCDLITDYADTWIYQIYENQKLIGATREPTQRRVMGQLTGGKSPSPITVIRVAQEDFQTDFGPQLPRLPWNRFQLVWNTAGSTGIDHFDIVAGTTPGGAIDPTNIIAREQFRLEGNYSFDLDPIDLSGTWNYGVIPRDAAMPAGNAGTTIAASVVVAVPPQDVALQADGTRFSMSAATGTVSVGFSW
jgi:hypothetical protein